MLFLYLNLFDVCDVQLFLCLLTFAAYMCEFLLSFFFIVAPNGQIYSINMMVTVKKLFTFCTPVREKISYNTEIHKGLS